MPWRKDRFCWDALILAGGRSLRMGRDKASLVVEGMPLLQLQADRSLKAGASTVWISHGHGAAPSPPQLSGARWIADDTPGGGPWPGMLRAMRASEAQALLVLAVDLPAMTPGFLRALADHAALGRGCIPETARGLEPLCAIYPLPDAILAAATLDPSTNPSPRRLAMRGLQDGWMRALPVDESDALALTNWNHPGDWSPPRPSQPG